MFKQKGWAHMNCWTLPLFYYLQQPKKKRTWMNIMDDYIMDDHKSVQDPKGNKSEAT